MIDLHCHILPTVDDGAKTWEIALQMCAMAWQDGIEHIVATPHANDEYYYDRDYLQSLADKLVAETGGKPKLTLGCDFHFSFDNIQAALESPGKFSIGHTPYLLVEFSDYSLPPSIEEHLGKLINIGLKPIITHPERNPMLQRTPERVLHFVDAGCAVQVTANSLTGRWGQKALATTKWLFEKQAVHMLATDAHSLESRPPILSKARDEAAKLVGAEIAEMLVTGNPKAVIAGEGLPYFPSI